MRLEFTLPIEPTAQERIRATVRGGYAHVYPSPSQQAKEKLLDTFLRDYKPLKPFAGPLVLEFTAGLPVPKSASKKRKGAMLRGEELPAKKPDLDNLAKQLKDAMGRVNFWHDDSQVVSLVCDKVYSECGFWRVKLTPVGLFSEAGKAA